MPRLLVLIFENMGNSAQAAYRVPLYSRIARFLFKPVFRGLFHILARITVTGEENVPFGHPYIVTFNHISIFDPALAVALWPEMVEILGASDVWKKPGQGQLAWLYHGIKVHRGEYDRLVFDKALSVLESGYPLLMSPEGGRSHSTALRRAKPGLAFIIERANVPVLPVGIVGTTDDFFNRALRGQRPVLEMHIGKPIRLPPVEGRGEQRRESRQRNADLVMAHIAGLLPDHYRGVYADEAIPPA
jgi:1-acyl-sn-glycerol-3-phosphate acyltransferase